MQGKDLEEVDKLVSSTVAKVLSLYPNSKEKIQEIHETLKEHTSHEMEEIEKMKSTIRNFFMANIGFLLVAGIWVGTIQTRQLRNIDDIKEIKVKQVEVDGRVSRNDVTSAEVRTRLSSIETTLIEIKQKLNGR